jgi:hypothetical protein
LLSGKKKLWEVYNPELDKTIHQTTKERIVNKIISWEPLNILDEIKYRKTLITENNSALAYNVGKYIATKDKAISYMWLRTTSKRPRPHHLALVWAMRSVNWGYPSGEYPWMLPNCKCSERPIYAE